MRYALCVMRYALCVMRYALCVMRYALCVMRYALCKNKKFGAKKSLTISEAYKSWRSGRDSNPRPLA